MNHMWNTKKPLHWEGTTKWEGHKNWQIGSFENFRKEKIVLWKIIKSIIFQYIYKLSTNSNLQYLITEC